MKTPMMCLSIRQPWAWLIVQGYKPIENRTWETQYKGPILIHAGKGMTQAEYQDARDFLNDMRLPTLKLPAFGELERGGIVGTARLVGCVYHHDSPWFVGPVGWVLENARPVPLVPCVGQLGLFMPPGPVVDRVMASGPLPTEGLTR